jgi:hypothetical protein
MIISLSVKNQSIESSGITDDYKDALCEYIWNALEANATRVQLDCVSNEACGIETLTITDNGEGINYNDLEETFGAFLASKKNLLSLKMKSRANKGKGRFSFIAFSDEAEWNTVYKDDKELYQYKIKLTDSKKEVVDCTEPQIANQQHTGSSVTFKGIHSLTVENMAFDKLEATLLKEFAWYLYLYKNRDINIFINEINIDYKKYINMELSETLTITIEDYEFDIKLIVWQEAIKEKYCCYYFDDSDVIRGRETTSFNRNTVDFNHSVFIKSNFFNGREDVTVNGENDQITLFEVAEDKKVNRKLRKVIQEIIEKKLSLVLSNKADDEIKKMIEVRETFPRFSNDIYGKMRKRDLINVTKNIYSLEPKIFYNLKPIQEKSILGLLNLLLNSEERENVLSIIEQIVELSQEQRKDLSNILKKTRLENIIDTIKFIDDRYKVIETLKTLVYDLSEFTNERDHIQKIIEQHYWLLGEQYYLASADQRMQKALEQYLNILYGCGDIKANLNDDAESERRMDIFLCNSRAIESSFETSLEENIIVELKAPKVPLTKKVLRQIEDYMDFVRKQPQFNSELRRWKFIAVCKEIDDDVKSRYTAFEDKGKIGLVCKVDLYEVYALTWDDIFKSFDLRHKFMLDKLKYDRDTMADQISNEILQEGREKANLLAKAVINP